MTDSKKTTRTLSTTAAACQTDESVFVEVINMDTDDDESEVDDGEEEKRVKRHRRSVLQTPIHQGIVPATQTDISIEVEKKKKRTIELKLPQTLDQSQVCYYIYTYHGRFNPLLITRSIET